MNKNNRRPTKKEEEYRAHVLKIVNFQHECYSFLRNAETRVELESIFLYELEKRNILLNHYFELNSINNKDISSFNIFNICADLKQAFEFSENYLSSLFNFSINHLVKNSIEISHISLKLLLCNREWNDYDLDNLENLVNNFYKHKRNDDEKLFFDIYSKGFCINCNEGYELYDEIRKKIKIFIISDNLKEYKEICKIWYADTYDENKVILNHVFLQDRVELDILSDLKITLKYMQKAKIYDFYIEKIKSFYVYNKPKNKINIRVKDFDSSKYNVPNLLTNLDINFNLPLDVIKSEIENIYNYLNSSVEKDYNLLFQDKRIFNTENIEIFNKSSNRSKLIMHLRDKFENLNIDEQKLKINIEYFVLLLFNFDCQLLALTQSDIEKIFQKEFDDSIISQDGEFFSQKRKHYKNILKIIIEEKYLSYILGININEIL